MKKTFIFIVLISIILTHLSCSEDDPASNENIENNGNNGNGNNGNGNNGNGNNSNNVKPPKLFMSSSHTLRKENGFVTGNLQVSVKNDSELKISSVKIILKSDNQPSISLGSWSEIKPSYQKTSTRVNITKLKYPVAVCTYTYNGKSYSQQYSY